MRATVRHPARRLRLLAQERFRKARLAERAYQRALTAVARQVGTLVAGFAPEGRVDNLPALQLALEDYSRLLKPWATTVSKRMHAEVNVRDLKAWEQLAQEMGLSLRQQLLRTETGDYMREALTLQVALITDLPLQVASRIHELTMRSLTTAGRGEDVEELIARSMAVSVSKARLIARTETARTASLLTEARATSIGCEQYIWRTAEDSDVRALHKKLNGQVYRYDDPPVAMENGERANPGQTPNCRCFGEPILPASLLGRAA
jgi:SPP1 gp7 family putative phage head morphogenesis protein